MKVMEIWLPLPITPERILTLLEERSGRKQTQAEDLEAAQLLAKFVNGAYFDGVDGISGYPLDSDATILAWEAEIEMTDLRRKLVAMMAELKNAAYQEGRRVAGKEVGA